MIANPVQYASGAKTVDVTIANLGGWDNVCWAYYRQPDGAYAEYEFGVSSTDPVTLSMRAGELFTILANSKIPDLAGATRRKSFSSGSGRYTYVCQVDA